MTERPAASRSPLAALLALQRGEGLFVLGAAGTFFLVLASYSIMRPIREQMGIARGWENLTWLFLGTLALTAVAEPIFGRVAARRRRRSLLPICYRFFALNILAFHAVLHLAPESWRVPTGYAIYMWMSVFNLFVVSLFWSLMSEVAPFGDARRVFPLVAVGGTLGALAGSLLTERAIEAIGLHLLLVSAVLLELAVHAARLAARTAPFRAGDASAGGGEVLGGSAWEGLTHLVKRPMLRWIGVYLVLFTSTATFLYFEQGRIVQGLADDPAARTRIFASIDRWSNTITLVAQLFVTGRLMQRLGPGPVLGILPVVTGLGFAALAAAPGAATLVVFQVVRRAGNYAFGKPARETLFTLCAPEDRWKSKNALDVFVYRAGDAIAALVMRGLPALGPFAVPVAGVGCAAAWLGVAWRLGRESRRGEAAEAPQSAAPSAPRDPNRPTER